MRMKPKSVKPKAPDAAIAGSSGSRLRYEYPETAREKVTEVRPYQLMCLICRTGRRDGQSYFFESKLDELAGIIAGDMNRPLFITCNCVGAYAWQNPGRAYDTPEGQEFNDRRDLAILRDLNMIPGTAQPASDVMRKIYKHIKTGDDICALKDGGGGQWNGCRFAASGNYERGIQAGEGRLLPPCRSDGERRHCKHQSAEQLYRERKLRIRPHHLVCIACIINGRKPNEMEPLEGDNAYEVAEIVQHDPDIPVELVEGPCMLCLPCAGYNPVRHICNAGIAMGLRDGKKDLDFLMLLGLKFGDVLPARTLYRKLFEALSSTKDLCGRGHEAAKVDEWLSCGEDGNESYLSSKAVKLHISGL